MDLPEFHGSVTVQNFRSPELLGGAVTVFFLFSGSCKLKTYWFVLYKVVAANSGVACVAL